MPLVNEFRYKVTAFVDGVLSFDERVLRYRQGMRRVQVPYANIRRFGAKLRGKTLGGVLTSELLLRTEPAPGQVKLVRVPLDATSEPGKAVLEELRRRLPDADTTRLPWEEAASRLGVKPHSWQDALVSRWGMIGLALVAGAAGVAAMQALAGPVVDAETRRTRGIVQLVAIGMGVVLLLIGYLRTRGKPR
jgi:hypothetical protein